VDCDRLLSAYDYTLPQDRIAQAPVVPRDSARLLVVKDTTEHAHAIFRDLPNLLKPGDLLVMNNTRVLPARLYGHKPSGLAVEILLLEPQPDENTTTDDFSTRWLSLVKPGRRLKPGTEIWFNSPTPDAADAQPPLKARILASDPATSGRIVEFEVPPGHSLKEQIYQLGQVPLPPYISDTDATPDQYQTVYADRLGAVAAPTAGLHFTPELLQTLEERGIQKTFITLHVGVGTFRPVEAEDITQHQMHAEWAEVSQEVVNLIHQTKAQGGRVIAVGTTVVRSLEGAAQSGTLHPLYDKTNLFIYPGYQWQVVDGLITNFHLPKSSLMMLVSALIGRQRLLDLYQVAIAEDYRFYSFGDAMLILPESRITKQE
jgi:S-adenosylmethionine:tRNA ribosyltransferase-isomerase